MHLLLLSSLLLLAACTGTSNGCLKVPFSVYGIYVIFELDDNCEYAIITRF